MPLMKAQSAQHIQQSAIVMDLADLEREAAAIVARARAEAARVLAEGQAQVQKEVARIHETARQAGYQEGLAAGLQEGRQKGQAEALAATDAQLKDLTARWSQTLELLHQHMPAHIADARTDLIRLALHIAARITHQEARRNRHVAPAIVEEALRMVAGGTGAPGTGRRVTLHVHPQEVDALQKYVPELLSKIRSIEDVQIRPDESLSPGGCILRCGAGEIDARIETQLDRISDELLGQPDEPKNDKVVP
jgi:flagellar assembly protein FliH